MRVRYRPKTVRLPRDVVVTFADGAKQRGLLRRPPSARYGCRALLPMLLVPEAASGPVQDTPGTRWPSRTRGSWRRSSAASGPRRPRGVECERGQAARETPAKTTRTVPLEFKDNETGEHFDVG